MRRLWTYSEAHFDKKFLTVRSLRQEYCLVECEAASCREIPMFQRHLGFHLHLSSILPWIQIQQVPSKRWYLSTNLNRVTSQKNILHITAMRSTNVTSVIRAKRTGKAVLWYAINVNGGSGGIIPLFLNFNTRWWSVVSFMPRAANTLFCTGRRFGSTGQESHESKELKCVK